MLPNFLIVGAAKSGTTSLYYYLKQHPEIYMSPIKEPYFFSFMNKKVDFKGPSDFIINRDTITDLDEYKKLFANIKNEKAYGECSTSYLFFPETIKNIKKYIPNVKIIIILRNPIERTFSHYKDLSMIGFEKLRFEEALDKEEERQKLNWMWHYQYTKQSLYYEKVKLYLNSFDLQQIRVYLFDDLKNDSLSLMQNIYNFLEVDDKFKPRVNKVYNISGTPKIEWLHHFDINNNILKEIFRPFFTRSLRAKVRNFIRMKNTKKYELTRETKQKLLPIFREDISKLQILLGKDLNSWMNV